MGGSQIYDKCQGPLVVLDVLQLCWDWTSAKEALRSSIEILGKDSLKPSSSGDGSSNTFGEHLFGQGRPEFGHRTMMLLVIAESFSVCGGHPGFCLQQTRWDLSLGRSPTWNLQGPLLMSPRWSRKYLPTPWSHLQESCLQNKGVSIYGEVEAEPSLRTFSSFSILHFFSLATCFPLGC